MESKKNKNTEKKDENIVEANVIIEEPKKADKKKLVGVGVAVAVVTAIATTLGLAAVSAFVGRDDEDEDLGGSVSDVFKDEEDEEEAF